MSSKSDFLLLNMIHTILLILTFYLIKMSPHVAKSIFTRSFLNTVK